MSRDDGQTNSQVVASKKGFYGHWDTETPERAAKELLTLEAPEGAGSQNYAAGRR